MALALSQPPPKRKRVASSSVLQAELNAEQASALEALSEVLRVAKRDQRWDVVEAIAGYMHDAAVELRQLAERTLERLEAEGRT